MDTVAIESPVDVLAEAYCRAEHGGHASGPQCEFGRKRAVRIMAYLPSKWRLTDDAREAVPTDEAVLMFRAEAEAFLATIGDLYWNSDQVSRAHQAITRFERALVEFRQPTPRPSRQENELHDYAAALDDQRPGGYVSRRPEA